MTDNATPMPGTAELLPCPFCGATEEDDCMGVVPYGEPGLVLFKVVCTCGASNEGGFSEVDVVSAWNRRDPDDIDDFCRAVLAGNRPRAGEPYDTVAKWLTRAAIASAKS